MRAVVAGVQGLVAPDADQRERDERAGENHPFITARRHRIVQQEMHRLAGSRAVGLSRAAGRLFCQRERAPEQIPDMTRTRESVRSASRRAAASWCTEGVARFVESLSVDGPGSRFRFLFGPERRQRCRRDVRTRRKRFRWLARQRWFGLGWFGLRRFRQRRFRRGWLGLWRRLQHRRFGLRGPFRRRRYGFGGRLGDRRVWRFRRCGGPRGCRWNRRRDRHRRLEPDGRYGRERRHDGDRRRRRAAVALSPAGPSMSRRPATTRTRARWRSLCGPWARRAISCAG